MKLFKSLILSILVCCIIFTPVSTTSAVKDFEDKPTTSSITSTIAGVVRKVIIYGTIFIFITSLPAGCEAFTSFEPVKLKPITPITSFGGDSEWLKQDLSGLRGSIRQEAAYDQYCAHGISGHRDCRMHRPTEGIHSQGTDRPLSDAPKKSGKIVCDQRGTCVDER